MEPTLKLKKITIIIHSCLLSEEHAVNVIEVSVGIEHVLESFPIFRTWMGLRKLAQHTKDDNSSMPQQVLLEVSR